MKYVTKQEVNRSSMKIVLNEPENFGGKIYLLSNFHRKRFSFIQHDFFFFFFFLLFLRSVKPIQHFIQHGIFLCWMKCWIGLTRPLENSSTFTGEKNLRRSLSLNKAASLQPDTLLKETLAQLFS